MTRLLMRLATTELFRARWSESIHEEWIRSVLRQRPDLAAHLNRPRHLMDAHVMDSLITGYDHLIETIDLPGETANIMAGIGRDRTGRFRKDLAYS